MSVQILSPQDKEDAVVGKAVQFTGTANSSVVRVKLSAEGRWEIGQSDVSGDQWSMTYSFTQSGTRQIIAQGLDSSNKPVASDEVWLSVEPAPISDLSLTANFTLRELIASSTADRRGIDNTPMHRRLTICVGSVKTFCSPPVTHLDRSSLILDFDQKP